MSGASPLRRWLSEWLMRLAARGLGRRHPDWAEAVAAEAEAVGDKDCLRWAAGCLLASLRAPGNAEALAYPAALAIGLAMLTAYQWSADESVLTLALVSALGLGLGLLEPRRVLISGIAVGSVVAGVNAFETLTGLLPAYEPAPHTLAHDLRWTLLTAPALLAAAAGRAAALRLRS